jgi:hypothetical protein
MSELPDFEIGFFQAKDGFARIVENLDREDQAVIRGDMGALRFQIQTGHFPLLLLGMFPSKRRKKGNAANQEPRSFSQSSA